MESCHAGGDEFNYQDPDKEHGTTEENFKCLLRKLHVHDKLHEKLKCADFLQITADSYLTQYDEPCKEQHLVQIFLRRLLTLDYRARYTTTQYCTQQDANLFETEADIFEIFDDLYLSIEEPTNLDKVHPMDVQMAVFHCADNFLKQLMVTKLSQCQYAVPLLVPNPFTKQIELPLWTFRQINKDWKIKKINKTFTQPMYKAETPMVAFFRFGSVSSSKSQLMNNLINKKHNTFFHRNCKGNSRSRVLMNGVVEIAWYLPSGKTTDTFTDCVAFCNLHGDAADNETQLNILTEMSSVNVVILPQLAADDKNIKTIKTNHNSTPLICLHEQKIPSKQKGMYTIRLDANDEEVVEQLREAIKNGLSRLSTKSFSVFRLFSDVAMLPHLKVDEDDDDDCKRGKEVSQQIMKLVENKDLSEVKESFVPCQGKMWHQWCQKNEELHRPKRNQVEIDISEKTTQMNKIRKLQQELEISKFMKLFLNEINSTQNMYVLKWLGILLDEHTSENLSALRIKYETTWKNFSNPNKDSEESEQAELEAISKNIEAATFGLEHILREIGQIYESCSSVQKNKEGMPFHFSSLPGLAAELMISGFPLELMDGDAAHVPLIWITAVLDELLKKLGDQRVFVLSILGIQSSGKSTMLNTMFGLQFPVSAGRCTRGAFMQLVKVSEEIKQQLKFDYILVVDTEGLCSTQQKRTRKHDNKLATFVVGLGNMTLINIKGENPSKMQDILQIVVQAFLRMKQVRLNPSCMFVHQNVDNTAEEKCIQARRHLQVELDEMTQTAAYEEVCDVQFFNHVIKIDFQNDVKYIGNLWEGDPPMAPPNPSYNENVQDLKKTILSKVSKSDGMSLKQFKDRIPSLWEALLNENFVFSFKDCWEISVYRRLETEYSKWTWRLRCAMLEIENKLLNKIVNEPINDADTQIDPQAELKQTSEDVKNVMSEYFNSNKDAQILIQWKTHFQIKIQELKEHIVRETKRKLNEVLQQQDLKRKIDAKKTHHENTLFEKSKELAFKVKEKAHDEETLKKEFDSFWEQCLAEITKDMPQICNIHVLIDVKQLLSSMDDSIPAYCWKESSELSDITSVPSYSDYIVSKKSGRSFWTFHRHSLQKEDEDKIRLLLTTIVKETDEMITSKPIAEKGYNIMYVQELIDFIQKKVKEHQEGEVKYAFKKQFTIDLTLHICKRANEIFTDRHRKFKEANDPLFYFNKMRGVYYSVFQNYCQGAKSSAIFGEIICNKLKEPIQQSAYKNTARELADEIKTNCESLNGNRSKLEKHILKTLAENENFDMYMNYIHNPAEQFKDFIRDEVKKYISKKFSVSVVPKIKKNIELLRQKIIEAAHEASVCVKENYGDVDLWLNHFTLKLSDVLKFSKKDLTGVSHDNIDVILLEDVMKTELPSVKLDINRTFKVVDFLGKLDYKDKPDEILIKHFCDCCWVQCPFCAAVCTNTMKNHCGDHSVPFHRNIGVNGWHYRGTTNLSCSFCTSEVAGNNSFYPKYTDDLTVPWKEYKKAGDPYADWSITPDTSELPYWKWFVCRFQKDLERRYKKTFDGSGKIPNGWWDFTTQEAIKSIETYF